MNRIFNIRSEQIRIRKHKKQNTALGIFETSSSEVKAKEQVNMRALNEHDLLQPRNCSEKQRLQSILPSLGSTPPPDKRTRCPKLRVPPCSCGNCPWGWPSPDCPPPYRWCQLPGQQGEPGPQYLRLPDCFLWNWHQHHQRCQPFGPLRLSICMVTTYFHARKDKITPDYMSFTIGHNAVIILNLAIFSVYSCLSIFNPFQNTSLIFCNEDSLVRKCEWLKGI